MQQQKNNMPFVFDILYVRWCSACVEGAFKYYIIACAGSTKQLITTQTCRVYKFNSTSVQSVTSTLSVFQRFLNCQTKRILIGGFALLLSVIAQGLDVRLAEMVSKAVVKMCRCFYTCWMTVALAVNKTLEISQVGRLVWSINKRNEFPIRRLDINQVIW